MTGTTVRAPFKSPLYEMTQTTPTCLWNDSASTRELTYSIDNGAVGATCNPVIVVSVLRQEMARWAPVLSQLIEQGPSATDDQIGWRLVEEISKNAASLLRREKFTLRSCKKRLVGGEGGVIPSIVKGRLKIENLLPALGFDQASIAA